MEVLRRIAIYGKGGIGKSTTTANLAAALADKGYRVMQIGCDPKADSTGTLMGGKQIPAILEVIREKKNGSDLSLDDIVFTGYGGVLCAESGGPTPGVGCAGRGIIAAFNALESLDAYEVYKPDFVLYDVLGDVVCGGFAMPLRNGYAQEVYVVTSGEKMSLFAAMNIALAVDQFKDRGYARLKGVIQNSRGIPDEQALVQAAADDMDSRVVVNIPRDTAVQRCEDMNVTVIEGEPNSDMAQVYRRLAELIASDE
jgi:nitrogenase iron protein NifH